MEDSYICQMLAKQILGSRGNTKGITSFVVYLGGLALILQ